MRTHTQYGHTLAAVVQRLRVRVYVPMHRYWLSLAHVRTHAHMRMYTQYWHTLAAVVQRAVRAHRARAQVRQRRLQDAYM